MRRECRERFPLDRLQKKPLVSDPGMHHGTCVTHVPWCMSGSLTQGGEENVPGIPGTRATRNLTYLARGPSHGICTGNTERRFNSLHPGKYGGVFLTMTSSLALCERNPPVTGGFLSQRPLIRSLDVFLDLRLNKRLSKQRRRRWFETPSRSFWRHCNVKCNLRTDIMDKVHEHFSWYWFQVDGA